MQQLLKKNKQLSNTTSLSFFAVSAFMRGLQKIAAAWRILQNDASLFFSKEKTHF